MFKKIILSHLRGRSIEVIAETRRIATESVSMAMPKPRSVALGLTVWGRALSSLGAEARLERS